MSCCKNERCCRENEEPYEQDEKQESHLSEDEVLIMQDILSVLTGSKFSQVLVAMNFLTKVFNDHVVDYSIGIKKDE